MIKYVTQKALSFLSAMIFLLAMFAAKAVKPETVNAVSADYPAVLLNIIVKER